LNYLFALPVAVSVTATPVFWPVEWRVILSFCCWKSRLAIVI
jgi:hypothetical protein